MPSSMLLLLLSFLLTSFEPAAALDRRARKTLTNKLRVFSLAKEGEEAIVILSVRCELRREIGGRTFEIEDLT